ncbi:MAG: hypothetical protein HKN32_07290 [Flavobacteriales bacterium]|nr:hypothetical protein [Flavobacteriales bacterium]
MNKNRLVALLTPIFLSSTIGLAQKVQKDSQTTVDPRDGQSYPIVQLGGLYWFAANLNFETQGSDCYEDDLIKCGDWGRLYPLEEIHTACPEGWRLPSTEDWDILKEIIEENGVQALYKPDHWKNNEEASNSSGLSLVPSGFKHKRKFQLQYINSTIWFNENTNQGSHWHFHTDGNNNADPFYFHTHDGEVFVRKFAIRCVCENAYLPE